MEIILKGFSNDGGIYKIYNKINNRIYIGSTSRFKKRFKSHKNNLIANKHKNQFLQNDFNKCGVNVFVFEVIEVVNGSKEDRLKKEQEYLDKFHDNQQQCYNLCKDALDNRGERKNKIPANPLTDKRCQTPSEELVKKRADAVAKFREENPELAHQQAVERAIKRWENHSANIVVTNKITKETITIVGSLREWCLQNNLNYKSFHQLVKGKNKFSGDWFLGTEEPIYEERKGEKRKPLSKEHKEKISGGKYAGMKLYKDNEELVIETNIKEQCKKLQIPYTTLLKVLNGKCNSVHGWKILVG